MSRTKGSFAEIIRNARLKKKLTMREAASLVSISPSYLSGLENNRYNRVPSGEIIKRLSLHLDVGLNKLLITASQISPDHDAWIRSMTKEDKKLVLDFYKSLKGIL